MQRGLKTPSGLRGAPSFQGSGALLFSCPASRDGEGPALCGRASPLASLGDCLDGVGARREYARVVAQVAGGPSVVKAPLLGPVQVQLYVSLGKIARLGLERGP